MNLLDYHHHTNHSFDSKALMEDVCRKAIEKGIIEICFTEHFSVNPLAPTFGHIHFGEYLQEIGHCQKKFENQLVIKAGMELCEPHLLKEQYAEALAPLHLDFILGSIHNINNQKLRKYLENKTEKTAYAGYFKEVYQMVCSADIDVIAHLDLIKRYSVNVMEQYNFNEHRDILEAILTKAIEKNIGIEINTSGLRGKLKEPLPSFDIIKLYKNLGGELLTLGSDSHFADSVGAGLFEAALLARECGFKYIFKYEKRNPIPVALK